MTAVPPPPPPAAPRLDDRPRELDERILTIWRLSTVTGLVPPLAILSVAGAMFAPGPWWVAPLAAIVVLVAMLVFYPRARHRRWRWRLGGLALELRFGVIVRRAASVPYFRIQQIDISRRPLERLLGVATLEVTTASAGGVATLPGLDADAAPEIRQELLVRAAAALATHAGDVRDAV